jgi:hypothetical protein
LHVFSGGRSHLVPIHSLYCWSRSRRSLSASPTTAASFAPVRLLHTQELPQLCDTSCLGSNITPALSPLGVQHFRGWPRLPGSFPGCEHTLPCRRKSHLSRASTSKIHPRHHVVSSVPPAVPLRLQQIYVMLSAPPQRSPSLSPTLSFRSLLPFTSPTDPHLRRRNKNTPIPPRPLTQTRRCPRLRRRWPLNHSPKSSQTTTSNLQHHRQIHVNDEHHIVPS